MLAIDQKMKKLFTVVLALGCAAIALIWPEWRTTLKAQGYDINELLQISAVIHPDTGTSPLETSLTVTIESGTPPFTYTLDYGDGGTHFGTDVTSTTWSYSYTYSNPGAYIAQVIVTDASSQTITQAFNIQVNDPAASDHIVLTDSSPSAIISAGSDKKVFGTSGPNSITLESGAKAELINFPGNNTITIQADSSVFSVSRSGVYVTFEGSDGTRLQMFATTTPQSIVFDDATFLLTIDSGQVLLGTQAINDTPGTINTLSTSGECGAYIAPGVWKEFDCYNLAAIGKTTGDDPFIPSWRLIGGYWQWGRKGPDSSQWYDTNTANFAHGPTGPDEAQANADEISEWDDSYAPDGAWSDSEKTANDPCPSGYRVPTEAQWDGVDDNNTQSTVGTWSSSDTNYSSGRFFGEDLMLPAAGYRNTRRSGSLYYRGDYGYYWSSTEDSGSSGNAWYLRFSSDSANAFNSFRRYGFSVRCVAE